jgi:hypothetical protein
MNPVRRIGTGRVTADFFASNYRFSASVVVFKKRLIDVLGDRMTDYLDIVDVYISRINHPGEIIATYAKGSVVKNEITFILLSNEIEGISKERFFAARDLIPVFISLPSFEIYGKLQWNIKDFDIKKILAIETHNFLPIVEAKAINTLVPQVVFQGPMILVNKSKVQLLCGRDTPDEAWQTS